MAIRVVQYGVGPIGVAVVRQIVARRGLEIVGALDIDPTKVGRDVGEIAELGPRLGVTVSPDALRTLKATRPDIVVLCTGSSLKQIRPQLETVLAARVPVVSTSEELAYPWGPNRRLAGAIDRLARRAKVAVLGTGVNPGFVMDALPIMFTSVCERVDAVEVERVQDARTRRLPFQQKIGAGLTPEQFQRKVADGTVRHVGLAESIWMIADALGWKLERIAEQIQPKIATEEVASEYLAVDPGYVCGLVQEATGYLDGRPVIRLHLEAYLGAPEAYDAVRIAGMPPLAVKIAGGVPGDVATASMVVNAVPKVLEAPPGLRTMRDLPLPSFFPGWRRAGR